MRRLTLLLLALAVALWAEGTARAPDAVLRDAVILYAVAVGLFLIAATPPERWPALAPRPSWRPTAKGLLVGAVTLGVAAWAGFWARPDVYTGWPLGAWLLATALILLAAAWDDRGRPLENPFPPRPRYGLRAPLARRTELALLALLLLLALFLRTWQLDRIPYGCQSDECNNALDALRWLQGEPYQPYVGTNEGQATLFTYLIAGLFALLGPDLLTLRLAPALVGTVTLLAFYTLARWRFDSPRLALLLTALFAASRWHLTFSRIVYELIMVPLVMALLLWSLLRALRHGRRLDWALVGFFLALGLNTYTAFRVVPFWIALFALYWLVGDLLHPQRRRQITRDLEGWGLALLTFGVAIAPLGVYILRHWDQFTSRIRHISVWNDVAQAGSWAPVWQNLRKALLMFNVQGDMAPLNNLPGAPMLDLFAGALLVLGLAYAVRYLNRPLPFLYVTGMMFQVSLVVLTVAHEAPNARRPIGALVLIYLLIGEVLAQVWDAFDAAWARMGQRAWQALLALTALAVIATNVHLYFGVQARRVDVQLAYSPNESAVGLYIRTLPPNTRVYVTRAYSHHSAVRFLGGRDVIPLNLSQHVPLREPVQEDVVYILDPPLKGVVPFLKRIYPDGDVQEHRGPGNVLLFISFHVPAESMERVRGARVAFIPGLEPTGLPQRTDVVRALDLDFRQAAPLPPPFTADVRAAVLVPGWGEYTFTVESAGEATLYLDAKPVLRVQDGRKAVRRTLVAGFLPLRLVLRARSTDAYVRVTWSGPGRPETVLATPDLYAIDVGPNGLVGYYYPNPNWEGPPRVVQRDFFILPNNILPEPFSIRWRGKIAIPVTGTYQFATRSDDGSYVYIDGQLVVDNGGVHGARWREGTIFLEQGFHDLEVRYFQQIGASEMAFYWTPPGGAREPVPLDYLYPVEGEEIPAALPPAPPPQATPTPPTTTVPPPDSAPLPTLALEPIWSVGVCGAGKGAYQQPRGVAVGPQGRIFVADTGNKRVVVLNPDGEVIATWGEAGEGPGQFVEPFDLAVAADGTVWVLDAVRQVVLRFTPEGAFLGEIQPQSPWYRPRGLDVAPDGTFYVADTGGVRITHVGPDGALLAQIGGPEGAVGPGQPTDVALAPDGTLYVVEAMSGLLWHISLDGQPLHRWTLPTSNTVDGPHVAVDARGRVWVTSPTTQSVHVYAGDGRGIGRWEAADVLGLPVGIAVDNASGRVYVSDSAQCRVVALPLAP